MNANISSMGFIGRVKDGKRKDFALFKSLNSGLNVPFEEVMTKISYLSLGRLERIFRVESWAPPSSGFVIT